MSAPSFGSAAARSAELPGEANPHDADGLLATELLMKRVRGAANLDHGRVIEVVVRRGWRRSRAIFADGDAGRRDGLGEADEPRLVHTPR